MCCWIKKKRLNRSNRIEGYQSVLNTKSVECKIGSWTKKHRIEPKFMRWIELNRLFELKYPFIEYWTKIYALNWTKIDSLNWNIPLLNIATIGLPYLRKLSILKRVLDYKEAIEIHAGLSLKESVSGSKWYQLNVRVDCTICCTIYLLIFCCVRVWSSNIMNLLKLESLRQGGVFIPLKGNRPCVS